MFLIPDITIELWPFIKVGFALTFGALMCIGSILVACVAIISVAGVIRGKFLEGGKVK